MVRVKSDGVHALTATFPSKFGIPLPSVCDGEGVAGPIAMLITINAADPIDWRQADHCDRVKDAATLPLKKGPHVLTLHFLGQPIMNFVARGFEKVD